MDDSPLVTGALRILLEETGHRVTVAASVAQTVAAAEAERPDLLLLDLTLPDGDGLDALATLRERDRLPRVTVAMTGHDDPATTRRCLEAGCREVMLKPVPVRELVRKVREWLGG